MITIQLDAVGAEVQDAQGPQGKLKILICVDQQSGLRVVIPFDENSARAIAAAFEGRPAIQIANGIPPEQRIKPAYDGH